MPGTERIDSRFERSLGLRICMVGIMMSIMDVPVVWERSLILG